MSEDSIKRIFFDMLQWVCVNRFSWIEEFKERMVAMSPEERRTIDWDEDALASLEGVS